MSDRFVEIAGVTRQWRGQGGVVDVSATVPRGAFVSILGPSGCGKSTLLRLLAGLETPETGTIRIAGRDVTHAPASSRGLSMVFQSYALFPHLSVTENIVFGLRVRRIPAADRAAKLAEAVAMLGLEGLGRRKPAELSGGQRQRVALARAVVAGHPLCLMDEPLSNLDAKLRHAVRRDIKALQRRLALTVVYVTHDQSEAMSLSDSVILMRAGRVEQIATPEALYAAPASIFAAEFVGDPPMAMIEGAALGASGEIVGIRPEHVALGPPEGADLVATVEETQFLGAQSAVFLRHGAARGLVATEPGRATAVPGTTVGLRLPQEFRVRFDARTGRALPDRHQDRGPGTPGAGDGRKANQVHQPTH